MIHAQRHYSDPFACHDNLLFTESAVCLRRGSASLVEMLRCRNHSLNKTRNPSSSLCPSQDVTSQNSTDKSVHATDFLSYNSAPNPPLLSPLLPPNQHFHRDSASHFNSPLLPLKLQPPSELRQRVPHGLRPHRHCKACMSNSQTTLLTSPARLSPPSQVVLPWSLYEGGDLTLLNHCLHHIVGRRTSYPNLSANHPMHSRREVGGTTSTVVDNTDKRQSLNVPFFSSPNLDRNLLLSPCDSEGRPDPLVG